MQLFDSAASRSGRLMQYDCDQILNLNFFSLPSPSSAVYVIIEQRGGGKEILSFILQ